MSHEQPLLNCIFGWGKTCRLYTDALEIAGKSYNLQDLTSLHPTYRKVLGISSARLELSFGLDHLVLRGIADPATVSRLVSHLQPYCSTSPHAAQARTRTRTRTRKRARAQARAWERTNKLPAMPASPGDTSSATYATGTLLSVEVPACDKTWLTGEPLALAEIPGVPVEDTTLTPGETLEAFARISNNLSTYASPLPVTLWQPPRTPRFQPPLHSVHLRSPAQKFDSQSIPVPAVKSSVLPIIHVPVRLQHGECAHYSIGATLCSDRISNAARASYPPLDQGLLILTNRRILYVGKRCQFTLAYTHLWYVSQLHASIALHIEGQFRRVIIELEHPREWASRIELLSFIARRARPRSELPTVSVAALPTLDMTDKRQALKARSASPLQAAPTHTTLPLLTAPVASRMIEARTLPLDEASALTCAERKTLEISPAPDEPAESQQSDAAVATRSALAGITTVDIPPSPHPENVPTREFPAPADITGLPTQEFTEIAETIDLFPAEEARTEEPSPESPDEPVDDDDSTIHLHERKLSLLRTIRLREKAPEKGLLGENTDRRIPRLRAPQQSS